MLPVGVNVPPGCAIPMPAKKKRRIKPVFIRSPKGSPHAYGDVIARAVEIGQAHRHSRPWGDAIWHQEVDLIVTSITGCGTEVQYLREPPTYGHLRRDRAAISQAGRVH